MRLMEKISSIISSQDKLDYLSIVYLISFYYLTMKNPLWPNNINIAIPLFLCSIGILVSIYLKNKYILNKIFSNGIVKWVITVFIYSLCLWIAKFKLNIQYGIAPENINYSALAYAFTLSFPVGAMICGFVVLFYVLLRDVSLNKLIIASLSSVFFAETLSQKINTNGKVEQLFTIGLIIVIPYSIINLITSLTSGKKQFNYKRLLTGSSSFAVFIALFTISISAMQYVEKFQEKFLFLDAYISTPCSHFNDNNLYIRKNDEQCYKIVGDRLFQSRLVLTNKVNYKLHGNEASPYTETK